MSFIEDLKLSVQEAVLNAVDADFLWRVSGGDSSFLEIPAVRDATVHLGPDVLEHLQADGVCLGICDAVSSLDTDFDTRDVLAKFDPTKDRNTLGHELGHWRAKPERLRWQTGINLVFYETYRPDRGYSLHCCGVGSMGDVTPAVAAWVQTAPRFLGEDDIRLARKNVGLTKNPILAALIEDRIASRKEW